MKERRNWKCLLEFSVWWVNFWVQGVFIVDWYRMRTMGSIDFGFLACKFIGWILWWVEAHLVVIRAWETELEKCCRSGFSAERLGLACGLSGWSKWRILGGNELWVVSWNLEIWMLACCCCWMAWEDEEGAVMILIFLSPPWLHVF
jgi:hypothetical protein